MTLFRELDEFETASDPEQERGAVRRYGPGRLTRSSGWRAGWNYRVEPLDDDEWDYELEGAGAAKWTGAPEQVLFRQRVLELHLARSRQLYGVPKPDLRDDQLARIPGLPEKMKMRVDAAEAAGRLLTASRSDLQQAREAGHADALRTTRITATSGYRGSAHQKAVWLGNFVGYYKRTAPQRSRIAEGPHSEEAVRYMISNFGIPDKTAAPGYSNHQAGIAIDLWQVRAPGYEVKTSTVESEKAKWRSTWFFGWLQQNAARFGFEPFDKEPWHWEFGSGRNRTATARRREAAGELELESASASVETAPHLGGLIHTFQSKSVPSVKVSVFCPAAAKGKTRVDVLLYAHGLLYGPCAAPKALPKGLIDEQPFELGRIVHDSGQAVVLIVPLFDWQARGRDSTVGRTARTLKNPDNVSRIVQECLDTVGVQAGGEAPSLSRLFLAGHSRGYAFLEPLGRAYGKLARPRAPLRASPGSGHWTRLTPTAITTPRRISVGQTPRQRRSGQRRLPCRRRDGARREAPREHRKGASARH